MKGQKAGEESGDSLFFKIKWLMFFRAVVVTLLLGATAVVQLRESPVLPVCFSGLLLRPHRVYLCLDPSLCPPPPPYPAPESLRLRPDPGGSFLHHSPDLFYRGNCLHLLLGLPLLHLQRRHDPLPEGRAADRLGQQHSLRDFAGPGVLPGHSSHRGAASLSISTTRAPMSST